MANVGDVIRLLMQRRELTGNQLAADIGLSATSVSKIVTGQSKPKQLTLTRLMKRLCTNAEEEQMVVRAFTGLTDSMSDEPEKSPRPLPEDEIERVTRYIEVKSMSVAFRNDVETALQEAGIKFKRDYRNDPFICDFLVESKGRRIAVDCKYNVNRDWDRTYATVRLLRERLPCECVIVVVPYLNRLATNARQEIIDSNGYITDLCNIEYLIREIALSFSLRPITGMS